MIAVVPVRDGRLPAGAETAVDAAAGRVLLVGDGVDAAAALLETDAVDVGCCEAGPYAPGAWAVALADALGSEGAIVLPGSADGRDLLGRLAGSLGWPAVAWCDEVDGAMAAATRHEGRQRVVHQFDGPFVASVVPRTPRGRRGPLPAPRPVALRIDPSGDARVVDLEDVGPGERQLGDADRVVAGGLGCGGARGLADLTRVALGLGATVGVTRPLADRGLAAHEQQIGTTGVSVSPDLYLAFGISGAVQHTAALGEPRRVVAVNTDPACPMMQLADLAVVADAPGTLAALADLLEAS